MPFTTGNFYLNMSQMKENATYWWTLVQNIFPDWTLNAVAAQLGNAQTESTINPGIWEGLSMSMSRGYGLFQWTPAKNYINWANGEGYDVTHMNTALLRLDYELETQIQYYPTSKYPISFRDFLTSKEDPGWLASAWLYNYERPEVMPQPVRESQARFWYQYLSGENPPTPVDPQPPYTPSNNRFWWIYYMKRR